MEGNGEPKSNPSPGAPSTCVIEEGVLKVWCPLYVPNGEYLAYGILEKARQFVQAAALNAERHAKQQRPIIRPVGMNGGN